MIDLWPNMIMMYPLRSYYEAAGDRRVIDLMTRYFRWQSGIPEERFLPASWQKFRGGDNLDSIYWLYNRTGGKWLLDLAVRNHRHTADWTRMADRRPAMALWRPCRNSFSDEYHCATPAGPTAIRCRLTAVL